MHPAWEQQEIMIARLKTLELSPSMRVWWIQRLFKCPHIQTGLRSHVCGRRAGGKRAMSQRCASVQAIIQALPQHGPDCLSHVTTHWDQRCRVSHNQRYCDSRQSLIVRRWEAMSQHARGPSMSHVTIQKTHWDQHWWVSPIPQA
jgi:hypothetical protein